MQDADGGGLRVLLDCGVFDVFECMPWPRKSGFDAGGISGVLKGWDLDFYCLAILGDIIGTFVSKFEL